MATLEKIRKKSVLLIVVIGVALLAFIVGDAIQNGSTLFGDGDTIAKLGDAKVSASEYQARLNQMSQAYPDMDSQALSQEVIDMMINEQLIDQAAAKLGVSVSDEQVTYYIFDQPLEPAQRFLQTYAQSLAQFTGGQMPDARMAYNIIFTPEKYGTTANDVQGLKDAWMAMEQETKKAAARNLYLTLMTGTIQANALDKAELFAQSAQSYTVDVARKPFGELDPKKYPVSDAELQAEYEKTKNTYKVDQLSKTIGYIAYQVNPSDNDIKEAGKLRTQALAAVKAGKPLGKDLTKAGVRQETLTTAAAGAPSPQIRNFLPTAAADTVAVFDMGGTFDIVKMISSTTANDSIQISFIQAMKDQVAPVTAALKAGTPVDSLSSKFAADKVMTQPSQWIQAQNSDVRGQLPANLMAALDTVAAGSVVTVTSTDEGDVLAYVQDVKAKVPVYKYDVVSYELYPSQETMDEATTKLTKYGQANNTMTKFMDNAGKAGFTAQSMPVSASVPGLPGGRNPQNGQISYMPRSSQLISWVMTEGEPGQVSPVFDNENAQAPVLYMAFVEDEYDEFAPYTDSLVKKEIEERVRRSKAGDAMVKQYSGKGDLAATAKAMGVDVVTDPQLRFGRSMMVADPVVAARMTGTKPGSKVNVVKGQDGVYAYTVKAKNPVTIKPADEQQSQQYNQTFKGRPQNLINMLRGNKRMTNNVYKLMGSH